MAEQLLPGAPKKTYLTHGEPVAAQSLAKGHTEKFSWDVAVARYLDTVEIGQA